MRLAFRSRLWFAAALMTTAAVLLPARAQAQLNLYVAQAGGGYATNGYGGASWLAMTGLLNYAFGAGNISIFADLSSLSTLLTYDRLWVDQRLYGTLTATEYSNVASFIATGRRTVLIGEHSSGPYPWNAQLASLVGGSGIIYNETSWTVGTTVFAHALTAGVSSVSPAAASTVTGGTALFSSNFATLWGADLSTLTIFDSNLQDDTYNTLTDNQTFNYNTAQWLASSTDLNVVPEPMTIVLLGTGLVGIGAARLRRRKERDAEG